MSDKSISAFPHSFQRVPDSPCYAESEGMDLRDYFAAKALQGMVGNPAADDYDDEVLRRENYKEYCKGFAESAYEMADAMMEARKI